MQTFSVWFFYVELKPLKLISILFGPEIFLCSSQNVFMRSKFENWKPNALLFTFLVRREILLFFKKNRTKS